jgi:hypothetical protein
MTKKTMTPQEKAKFDASLRNAATETTDTMGRILMNAILNLATTHGTLKEENVLELPITATVRILDPKVNNGITHVCTQTCITIFDTEIVCIERCHTHVE